MKQPLHHSPAPAATADLVDEHGEGIDVCELQLHQYGGVAAFSGTIRTVRCHGDNALLRSVLGEPGEGRVLVVDGGGSLASALLGDMLAASAVEHGWAGVVINGCVRDVAALRGMPLGVKALGSIPRRSARDGVGEVDVEVSFGGARFVPGATVWSDDDGVVTR